MSSMQRRSTSDLRSSAHLGPSKPGSSSSSLPLQSSSPSKEKPFPPSAIPRPTTTTFARSIRSNTNRTVSASYLQSSSSSSSEASGVGLGGFGGTVARPPRPYTPSLTNGRASPALRRSFSHSVGQKLGATPTGRLTPSGARGQLNRKKKKKKTKGRGHKESASDSSTSSEELSELEIPEPLKPMSERGTNDKGSDTQALEEEARKVFAKAWAGFDPGDRGEIYIFDLISFFRRLGELLPGNSEDAVLSEEQEKSMNEFMNSNAGMYLNKESVQAIFLECVGTQLIEKIAIAVSPESSIELEGEIKGSGSGEVSSPKASPRKGGFHDALGRPRPKQRRNSLKPYAREDDEVSLLSNMDATDSSYIEPVRSSTPLPEGKDVPHKKPSERLFDQDEFGVDRSLMGLAGHSSLLGPMPEVSVGFVPDVGADDVMSPVEEGLGVKEQEAKRKRLAELCENVINSRGDEEPLNPHDTKKLIRAFPVLYKENDMQTKKNQEQKRKMEYDREIYDANRTELEVKIHEGEQAIEEYRKQQEDLKAKLRKATDEIKKHLKELEVSETNRSNLEHQKETLQVRLDEEKRRLTELIQKVNEMSGKADQDRKTIDKLERIVVSEQRSVEKLTKELREAQQSIEEEKSANQELENENISLHNTIRSEREKIFRLEKDFERMGFVNSGSPYASAFKREEETLLEFHRRRVAELDNLSDPSWVSESCNQTITLKGELAGAVFESPSSTYSRKAGSQSVAASEERARSTDSRKPGYSKAESVRQRSVSSGNRPLLQLFPTDPPDYNGQQSKTSDSSQHSSGQALKTSGAPQGSSGQRAMTFGSLQASASEKTQPAKSAASEQLSEGGDNDEDETLSTLSSPSEYIGFDPNVRSASNKESFASIERDHVYWEKAPPVSGEDTLAQMGAKARGDGGLIPTHNTLAPPSPEEPPLEAPPDPRLPEEPRKEEEGNKGTPNSNHLPWPLSPGEPPKMPSSPRLPKKWRRWSNRLPSSDNEEVPENPPTSGAIYQEIISTSWETHDRLTKLMELDRITLDDARFVANFVLEQSKDDHILIVAIWWLANRAERAARRTLREQQGPWPRGQRKSMIPVHSPLGILAWPSKMIWHIIGGWEEELDKADNETIDSASKVAAGLKGTSTTEETASKKVAAATKVPASTTSRGTELALAYQQDRGIGNVLNRRKDPNSIPRNLPAYILRAGPKPGHAWGILTLLLWIALASLLTHNVWLYWIMRRDRLTWEELNAVRGFEGGVWSRGCSDSEGWRAWDVMFEWIAKWAVINDVVIPS
ncbi:structural molecule activity protein [Rhizina undulata]